MTESSPMANLQLIRFDDQDYIFILIDLTDKNDIEWFFGRFCLKTFQASNHQRVSTGLRGSAN